MFGCSDPEEGGERKPQGGKSDAGEHMDASVMPLPDAGKKPGMSGETCDDVKCDPNATCMDSSGKPQCLCADGFAGDGKTCTDIDECKTDNGGCASNAACVNQPGSHRCLCDEGLTGDGKTCTPIKVNECGDAELNTCDPNAQCTDTDSGFTCACGAGTSGDGAGCADVDECTAGSDDCVANSTCKNTFGGFSCGCAPGFTGDGKVECKSLCDGACDPGVQCTVAGNAPGVGGVNGSAAVCAPSQCARGFVRNGGSNMCVAITGGECAQCDGQGSDDDLAAICGGTQGSAACECASGSGTVGSCDVDECATNNGGCGAAAQYKCTNLPGGFACSCQPGYVRNVDGECVDVNECNETPGPCHPNATCTNTTGSYTCECKAGFTGDGSVCTDVDECSAGSDNCLDDGTARCVNTNGSFSCPCKRGYKGDGVTSCDDLNECSAGLDDCADNATCTNTTPDQNPFGYTCTCNAGLGGDGTQCSDVDECNNASLFDCPANSTCVNQDPGYSCECKGGFTGDDPKSCYCDLSGYWAVRQDVDVCWCDRVLADVTIISGSSTEASVWELHKLTYDGQTIKVEKKGCGADNEPDFVSPFFKSCPPGNPGCSDSQLVSETYSSYVPNAAFDSLDLASGNDIDEPGIVPGSKFTTPSEAALAGIDLGDDPVAASWPAPFTVGNPTISEPGGAAPTWVDTDKDGEAGFTFWPRPPSKETDRSTSSARRYYSYTPVDVDADDNVSARATCVSLATRVISHLDADVTSCDHIVGNVVNDRTEGRIHSCIKLSVPSDWDDDFTCSADDWEAADTAERCDDADIERLDATDQSNESQATFEMVKIGELGDDVDCAAVRKALPAISRNSPTPISCDCQ